MVYFGCINEKEFNELSSEEQKHHVIKKGVLEELTIDPLAKNSIPTNIEKDEFIKELRISKHLINEFYAYVLKALNPDIENASLDFYFGFDKKIYGLDSKEKKMLALKAFKDIAKDYLSNEIQVFQHEKSSRGIKHVIPQSILSRLFDQQTLFKEELAGTDLINQYIFGNMEAFNASNIYDQELIDSVEKFESNLKILVSLNDQYDFEKDEYFTRTAILKEKFLSKFDILFKSFEAYCFADQKILQIKDLHNVRIEGLYQAMLDAELIEPNALKFKDFVNNEYYFSITKIRSYYRQTNKSHEERVNTYSSEWSKLSFPK
ncbi:hypothetical protein KCTC52924_03592 [Arenibacter antarcticus]|uniref:Uncharacterized protein n=1 Tax=Arenibacter antarcticus TaxID=2040469 RepID=A0ABW5VHZ6_9FLAO|nr:hypothetical protein [Arenibacter sp. H213]MCM4169814.1 hypothetical protein [Arenibacter sp. H213]